MTSYRYALIAAFILAYAPVAGAESNLIATVNIQHIMQESAAAKSANEQLTNKQKAFQTEITKRDEQLQKEDQELKKQRGVLSKEAFEDKSRAFRNKVTEVQKEVQSKKALLDNAYARAVGEIQKTVSQIIADMAKEKGFVVALPTSQILYTDSKLDISKDVLEQLNKKLPKLDVKFEAPKK